MTTTTIRKYDANDKADEDEVDGKDDDDDDGDDDDDCDDDDYDDDDDRTYLVSSFCALSLIAFPRSFLPLAISIPFSTIH